MRKLFLTGACMLLLFSLVTAPLQGATAQAKDEPNAQLFQTKCQKCHSLERINEAHLTRDKARTVVEKMRSKEGANISQEDAKSIYEYLSDYFVVAPSPPLAPVPIR